MKYIKKPIPIEGRQWTEKVPPSPVVPLPQDRWDDPVFAAERGFPPNACGWIATREGGHIVMPGDWIMGPGPYGEYWAVKPSYFDLMYVPADAVSEKQP